MNISMAYVWQAFVAGVKNVTRRNWTPEYAARWMPRTLHNVYNRSARFGGQIIGQLRCLEVPYVEPTSIMPDNDYEAEGLAFLDAHPFLIPSHHIDFERWRQDDELLYVLRFEVMRVVPAWKDHLAACVAAGKLLPEPPKPGGSP
jgi:hypothetical protein